MAKRLGWTFLIGGALGTLSQLVFWFISAVFADPTLEPTGLLAVLSETVASDTLVAMGVIGGVLGGLGVYRHLAAKTTFGANLPFSGFAFGVGEKMIHGWTKKRPDNFWLCTWRGMWMLIWFNVIVFVATFIVAGLYYYLGGIHDSSTFLLVQPTVHVEGPLLILTSFITGGVVTCFFEIILLLTRLPFVVVLAFAWIFGAIITPLGIMPWLSEFGGWGVNVMIANGGQILYNVAFMFFNGNPMAMPEFIILVVTILCLFLTGWLCFGVHIFKYGHKTQDPASYGLRHGDGTPAVDDDLTGFPEPAKTAPPAKTMDVKVYLGENQ